MRWTCSAVPAAAGAAAGGVNALNNINVKSIAPQVPIRDLLPGGSGKRRRDDRRAIAGVTFPLVDKTFTPDAAGGLTDGLTPDSVTSKFLYRFPYLGVPYDGYHTPSS